MTPHTWRRFISLPLTLCNSSERQLFQAIPEAQKAAVQAPGGSGAMGKAMGKSSEREKGKGKGKNKGSHLPRSCL